MPSKRVSTLSPVGGNGVSAVRELSEQVGPLKPRKKRSPTLGRKHSVRALNSIYMVETDEYANEAHSDATRILQKDSWCPMVNSKGLCL